MTIQETAQKAGRVLIVNSDQEIIRILDVNLSHANLEVVSALTGTEALNKLHHNESDLIIMDTALPDMTLTEMRRRIREMSPASRIPVILIGNRPKNTDAIPRPEDTTIHVITKPFDPKEVVALVQGYLIHKERMINTNPVTGLPNRMQVSKEISRLLDQKATLAAIYITTHDLPAINKAYGYAQGDQIIRLLGDIVSEAVRVFGNPTDLAGHLESANFLVISSPWKTRTLCRKIIADYNQRIKFLYPDEHLQTGYVAYKNTPGAKGPTPKMGIHIAVVTNQKCTFVHPFEIIEAASEQIEFLKNSTESNCYFDLKIHGVEPSLTSSHQEVTQVYKEGLKAIKGALAWFDFITSELDLPLSEMKDYLQYLKSDATNLTGEQRKKVEALEENYNRVNRIVEGMVRLARHDEDIGSGVLYDDVDIREIIGWVIKQVSGLAAERRIKTEIEVAGEIGRIIRDKKSLVQSLLYIIRNEINASPPGSHLHIHLSDKNNEFIGIKISNPDHYIPARSLNALLHRRSSTSTETSINELFPAKIMVKAMGGEVIATSDKGKGTIYTVTIPKKWLSSIQEVDTLQLAMEMSRKEAREALKKTQQIIASQLKQPPHDIKFSLDRLSEKIQEMAVLCNRSLFLADDFNMRLEIQQDRLLQHEAEQSAASEAILTICRDMARTMQIKKLFSPESAKSVSDCSMAIAKELKLSESDRQALYQAVLFKDLAFAFCRHDDNIMGVPVTPAIRDRLNLVWKALSSIPCFSAACNFILYRWESYDGTGGIFGVKGADIPLGSRILALADTYHYLLSDHPEQGKLGLEPAVQKIVENAGLSFDPHVVSAFLKLWKRNEMKMVPAED